MRRFTKYVLVGRKKRIKSRSSHLNPNVLLLKSQSYAYSSKYNFTIQLTCLKNAELMLKWIQSRLDAKRTFCWLPP